MGRSKVVDELRFIRLSVDDAGTSEQMYGKFLSCTTVGLQCKSGHETIVHNIEKHVVDGSVGRVVM
jgi:hypothetical protein